jgi:hypothetical protein
MSGTLALWHYLLNSENKTEFDQKPALVRSQLVIYPYLTTPSMRIYLWRKAGCFVLFWPDPPNWDASDCVLGVFRKLLTRRGARAWFHNVWTSSAKVREYWMIFSLKIKLNHSWNFWRNWNVPLVLLESSGWAGFNGIYLVRFGFRMREILIFKWFLLLKIQINSQKIRFWKEISVEDVVDIQMCFIWNKHFKNHNSGTTPVSIHLCINVVWVYILPRYICSVQIGYFIFLKSIYINKKHIQGYVNLKK